MSESTGQRISKSAWVVAVGLVLAAAVIAQETPKLASPPPHVVGAGDKTHGAELFANSGCEHCHGNAGIKGGIGPSLRDVAKHKKPGEIYAQIHDGKVAMPAFGEQLKPEEIDDLIAYLRSKRTATK